MTRTRAPWIASAAARFTVVVVFPTPPFWFATTRTRVVTGVGSLGPLRLIICTASRAWAAIGVSSSAAGAAAEPPMSVGLGGVSSYGTGGP
jgi:hypothetical protein